MNGMPQQPNQPQGPFTDDSNWGQLPQPQQPQQPNNNWAQLLGQLAHAYAKKQQAMAPPQPTPVQLPSAPPDIPLPPAQGNAWNRASDNQRTPGHPMYDVRTQMDQQMAELKKTTDKYFADKQWSIGQGPPKPTVVDPNAPQQSAQPAPAQSQAAAPAQAQPSGGQPQQQSSYRSPQRYSSDPATEVPTSPPKPPKKDEKKNKGDSKAKDKGTTNPSNRQMMIDPMMQARFEASKKRESQQPPQGSRSNRNRQAIEVNEPTGWSAKELMNPWPVAQSVGARLRDMGRGSVRDPGDDMRGIVNDLGALSAGSPQDTRVGKAFQSGVDKFNQFRDAYQGNPDALRETLVDVSQGATGVAAGRGLQGKLGRGPARGSSPSSATPTPPSSTTGSKLKGTLATPTPKPVVDRKKFIPPGKLSKSVKSIKPDVVIKEGQDLGGKLGKSGKPYNNEGRPLDPKARPRPMARSEADSPKPSRVEPAGKPAPKSTRTKKKGK